MGTQPTWGIPKVRGTLFRGSILSTIVYWGLYWGSPPILGNYHVDVHPDSANPDA